MKFEVDLPPTVLVPKDVGREQQGRGGGGLLPVSLGLPVLSPDRSLKTTYMPGKEAALKV